MIRICVKIVQNKTYIDKDFIKNFGIDKVNLYGYTIVEIEEKYRDCEASDFDGLYFNISKYNERKSKLENEEIIRNNIARMNELTKDFVQHSIGASIPDIDIKKQEFVRLHNEVRNLQGKEPRIYYFN